VIDTQSTEVPGVTVLDQTDPRGQYTERWHTDSTFLEEPPWGAVLRAVQLPPVGGDTCWASMYAAYEQLSPPMRRFLDGLTAEHSTSILDAVLDKLPNVVRRERMPPVRHPVVRVHPETGRKLLFVNANFTDRIVDLDEAESRTLLDFLFHHLGKPHFQVRYHWTPNAVALWDNRSTQHCAMPDYCERRLMYRCMMRGDRPVGPVPMSKDS
jgi:taurine dioxygenase